MGAPHRIEQMFPEVHWTGSSGIHRSWAAHTLLPEASPTQTILALRKANVGAALWRAIQKHFGAFPEWIVSKEEFTALLLTDCWRHLNGLEDSTSDRKLVNPNTGNKFHRIALAPDQKLVGGIRFWCDYYGDDSLDASQKSPTFGWRFRLEGQQEDDQKTRDRTREMVEAMLEEHEGIAEMLMEFAEPNKNVVEAYTCQLEAIMEIEQ